MQNPIRKELNNSQKFLSHDVELLQLCILVIEYKFKLFLYHSDNFVFCEVNMFETSEIIVVCEVTMFVSFRN